MSGKRAKPSAWRFLRAGPVAIVAVVVWVMVGLFLLLPGSGTDQAHDWGLDPIPSNTDEGAADADAPGAGTPDESAPSPSVADPTTSGESLTTPDGRALEQSPEGELELSDASASASTTQPHPRPTSDPTSAAPTEHTPGPPEDNPGKKKGHDKAHGPPGQRP